MQRFFYEKNNPSNYSMQFYETETIDGSGSAQEVALCQRLTHKFADWGHPQSLLSAKPQARSQVIKIAASQSQHWRLIPN